MRSMRIMKIIYRRKSTSSARMTQYPKICQSDWQGVTIRDVARTHTIPLRAETKGMDSPGVIILIFLRSMQGMAFKVEILTYRAMLIA
jgi:hypothetical protein